MSRATPSERRHASRREPHGQPEPHGLVPDPEQLGDAPGCTGPDWPSAVVLPWSHRRQDSSEDIRIAQRLTDKATTMIGAAQDLMDGVPVQDAL